MTPERLAGLVARWVRLYTRNLPPPIAERRIDEIDADLHDHIANDRANGTRQWRIAFSIAARMVRGVAADLSWRRRAIASPSTRKEAIGGAAIVLGEMDDAPGLVLFGCLLIIGTVALAVRTAQRSE